MTTPRLLSERYELGEPLGYGGMSEVHRGMDTRLGRDVAIKVLRADLARDPQFQMRFRREAQNAAALNHPAIVAVYDTGEVQSEFGPLPYIVMEYVDGQTLREIVKTTGPMTQQKVIEVMADVCAALDFSHRHQIIHRDVKPANVMITLGGAVKVMDFGIARALGEGQNVTQTAAVIGTAQYLSPEQARGEAVDARSDVYAAGCVLFELLTGEPPFTGDTPVAVAYQHVREDPRRPSELNPQIPPALDAVVLKALSKNPANRYQSAAEMRTDLVRVRNGQSPLAPAVLSEDERTAMLAAGAGPATGATRRINGAGGRRAAAAQVVHDWEDEDPPPRTGRRVALGIAAAVALALVGFVAYILLSGPAAPEQVTIPNVIGAPEQDALNQLIGAGLRPVAQPRESPPEQLGLVVETNPPVGTSVVERAEITVFVGSGPAETNVPQLAGLEPAAAQDLLARFGLTLGAQTEEATSDANLVGKIVSSTPGPGETVPAGSAVAVVIGVEPTTAAIPEVAGQEPDAAQQALEDAGFAVTRQDVEGGEEGVVVGTDPAAGTQAELGSTVTLQIGTGNDVPDVRGEELDDAVRILRDAGFALDDIRQQRQPVTDRDQDDIVLEQTTQPDPSAPSGQLIILTVGEFGGGVFGN
ncbi:MAG TPA: Stk1 family PASTA domain-containing Ser/Thr kinase [Pseudonocardia sp.]|nr:Stk1 family PASTA domain-containing Ser/Thr kinase [Pseudonocardia sp.]